MASYTSMEQIIKTMVGEKYYDIIPTYAELARNKVLNHLFPFNVDATWEDVPERYLLQTCEIAAYLIGKIGAEGETKHSENGTDRTYESASIPPSMYRGMVPFAEVPR